MSRNIIARIQGRTTKPPKVRPKATPKTTPMLRPPGMPVQPIHVVNPHDLRKVVAPAYTPPRGKPFPKVVYPPGSAVNRPLKNGGKVTVKPKRGKK